MSFLQKLKPVFLPLPDNMNPRDLRILVATWFGAGRIKPAPGTMGSLAAIPFGYAINATGGPLSLALAAFLMFILGTMASNYFGKLSGKKDDQMIVVDEVVGMWIAGIPAESEPALWVVAFILFRLFDIYKPWPASYFDNKGKNTAPDAKCGFHVVMDDVIAGIYAMLGTAGAALIVIERYS